MSIYGGFGLREQESRYNIMLFDLVLSLSARLLSQKQPAGQSASLLGRAGSSRQTNTSTNTLIVTAWQEVSGHSLKQS